MLLENPYFPSLYLRPLIFCDKFNANKSSAFGMINQKLYTTFKINVEWNFQAVYPSYKGTSLHIFSCIQTTM